MVDFRLGRFSYGEADRVSVRQTTWALVESAPHRRHCDGRGNQGFHGRNWGLPGSMLWLPSEDVMPLRLVGRSWGKAWQSRSVVPASFSRKLVLLAADGAIILNVRFQAAF